MKYLGEKSASTVLSKLFGGLWYCLILVASLFVLAIGLSIFQPSFTPDIAVLSKPLEKLQAMSTWQLIFITAYICVNFFLLLTILKKARQLFTNFKNNIVFEQNNVTCISSIAKLTALYAVITFSLSTLFTSLILLVLCEIFKNGTALQEEHNYTV